MATVAPATPADQSADLMQKLSLDSKSKSEDASAVTKTSVVQYGSSNGGEPIAPIPIYERSLTPWLQEHTDASMCYLPNGYSSALYYGGYDGSVTEWEDYPRYVNSDGVEVPPLGVYGDMYHPGYGYAPYSPYPSPGSPVPNMGHNNQLYTPQHYHFPATYYQPQTPSGAPYTASQNPSSKGDVSTSTATELPPVPVDTTKANSNEIVKASTNSNNGTTKAKPNQQNTPSNTGVSFGKGTLPGLNPSSGYQDPRFGYDGMWSPISWYDGSMFPDGQQKPTSTNNGSSMASHIANTTSTRNQNLHPLPYLSGMHTPRSSAPGIVNKMYPNNRIYGQNANGFKGNQSFRSNIYDSSMHGRWVMSMDNKYKHRSQGNGFYGYGNENLEGLSELNKGPRAGHFRSLKGFGPNFSVAVRGQSLSTSVQDPSEVPDRDQYNKTDFPVTYSDAKFFIIKSYSEDDIHKSIKYNVWASTPHGNKKLDAAYQESKEKINGCPVFLLFSVNTSGQFVGIAEMVGPVDFNKTLDYWQQDKWIGCFPIKWHIVKDVPNSILKHITLENNDNKPVTNSRDTQEVKLEQGLQLLKLFKEHVSMTSILDDFSFYENRQKVMQEKRPKQQQLQKKLVDGKLAIFDEKEKDNANGRPVLQKPLELVSILKKESAQNALTVSEFTLAEKNGVPAVSGVAPKDAKPVTEKRVVTNGVSNCY